MRAGGSAEVAVLVGIHPKTVPGWARAGRLPVAYRTGDGPGSAWVFDLDEVERLISEGVLATNQHRDAGRVQAYRELRALGLTFTQTAARLRMSADSLHALVTRHDCYVEPRPERLARELIDRWCVRRQSFMVQDFPDRWDPEHVTAAVRRALATGRIVAAGRRKGFNGSWAQSYTPAAVSLADSVESSSSVLAVAS